LITDGHGTPLAVLLTGGNRNDVTQLLPLLDAIPPVRGRVGRPRRKPDSLFADRGYDHDIYRDQVRARGIVPAIARRGTLHGTGPDAGLSNERCSQGVGATDGLLRGGRRR
jgi:transposase